MVRMNEWKGENDVGDNFLISHSTQYLPPFPYFHVMEAGIHCQRCSSGTTLPHLFSCSFRLQGSRLWLQSPPPPSPFVSVLCTRVINFVLLLFVPVTRSPLFWASSPWSTRLEVFFFCEPWQVPNWMMNVPLFLCNWTASTLIGLEYPPPSHHYHHHLHTLVDFNPPAFSTSSCSRWRPLPGRVSVDVCQVFPSICLITSSPCLFGGPVINYAKPLLFWQ